MRLKEWSAFVLLGLIWGSSFLWIKIAVEEIGPFMLVAWRLLFGLVGLLFVMRAQKQSFPKLDDRRTWLAYLFMGIFNTGLPFVLISWGETRIDSGLASILNAMVPLFTIIIAHFALHDEKLTLPRLAGLGAGFAGMVVLFSRSLATGAIGSDPLGQLAVVGAALSYALGLTFGRRYLRGQPAVVQSATTLLVADALVWLALPFAEPIHFPMLPVTWLALAWLGLLGSCTAYLLFFSLINWWGPTRASLVTYVFPVIGLVLGIYFGHESADWTLAGGTALIVAGIVLVNLKKG